MGDIKFWENNDGLSQVLKKGQQNILEDRRFSCLVELRFELQIVLVEYIL